MWFPATISICTFLMICLFSNFFVLLNVILVYLMYYKVTTIFYRKVWSLIKNMIWCIIKVIKLNLFDYVWMQITFALTMKQLLSFDPCEWTESVRKEYLLVIDGFFSIPLPFFSTTYNRAIKVILPSLFFSTSFIISTFFLLFYIINMLHLVITLLLIYP